MSLFFAVPLAIPSFLVCRSLNIPQREIWLREEDYLHERSQASTLLFMLLCCFASPPPPWECFDVFNVGRGGIWIRKLLTFGKETAPIMSKYHMLTSEIPVRLG